MKKLTSFILALVLCLSLSIPAFATDSNISAIEEGIQVLLNSGWTQSEIEDIVSDGISPSISYPAGCGISLSSSSKFDEMLPNPYCSFYV